MLMLRCCLSNSMSTSISDRHDSLLMGSQSGLETFLPAVFLLQVACLASRLHHRMFGLLLTADRHDPAVEQKSVKRFKNQSLYRKINFQCFTDTQGHSSHGARLTQQQQTLPLLFITQASQRAVELLDTHCV